MLAARMPLAEAASASLVAVTAFGVASASSYAWSGLVDWPIAALLIAGGAGGAIAGTRLNTALSGHKTAMTRIFAAIVIAAGLYVGIRGLAPLLA